MTSKRRRLAALAGALALGAAALPVLPARAATVAIVKPVMAATSNGAGATNFPSGTTTVFFRYTILTPSQADTGRVLIYPAGSATPIAQADLFLRNAIGAAAGLTVNGGFPDGGYCTAVKIDGRTERLGGSMPLSWTVGSGPVPACSGKLAAKISGRLKPGHAGATAVTIRDAKGRAVKGVSVTLDARSAGVSKLLHASTSFSGRATFRNVRATRAGWAQITAAKKGYVDAHARVRVG